MDTNENSAKGENEKSKKQVTFHDFIKPNPKKSPHSDSKKTTKEVKVTVTENVAVVPEMSIPVRSDKELPLPGPSMAQNTENELHPNLRLLDERRQSVWKKMDAVVAETEKVYKTRVSLVNSVEKQLINIIQENAKKTIASLNKNRETLLETIAQKLQEFESLNKVCEEDIATLNGTQNRLKETLERVGFNV